jgi:hypothetical protein
MWLCIQNRKVINKCLVPSIKAYKMTDIAFISKVEHPIPISLNFWASYDKQDIY